MCLSVFLLADQAIAVPLNPTNYPGLFLHPVEEEYQSETLAGIRKVADAKHVYNLMPAGYCGCYFGYESTEEFQESLKERASNPDLKYANTPEEAEVMCLRIMFKSSTLMYGIDRSSVKL